MGVDVIDLGLSTTPTVELMVQKYNATGGIIITQIKCLYEINLNISTSVIILIICLKKIKNNIEITNEVKKLICIEFLTTNKKKFLFLLPIVKPTIPSVEKA